MAIRKGAWVVLAQESFERRMKGMRNTVNSFRVNKGTNKENGYVQICTSPYMIRVEAREIAQVLK